MQCLRSVLTLLVALTMLVACGKTTITKNPGPSDGGGALGSAWATSLEIDPNARVGHDFWIRFVLSGAAGDIENTLIRFNLPPNVIVTSGNKESTRLNFQQNQAYSQTVWIRLETLESPILVSAEAQGVFKNNRTLADAGVARYLIKQSDGRIISATDIPPVASTPIFGLQPYTELPLEPTPRVPRPYPHK